MVSYYNEIDKQKVAWLKKLIAAGLIAPGDVDDRSIAKVRPGDLDGYVQCHFFAGIGIWSYSLRLAGWPDEREVWTGSCPCQPFSAAGKGKAFDDSRHLWPAWFPLIEARKPIVCFGEQVSSIDGLAWFDNVQADLDQAGYTVGAMDTCAAGVGAPHERQRLYWVADATVGSCGALDRESGSRDGLQGTTRGCNIPFGLADAALGGCRIERDAGGYADGHGVVSGPGFSEGPGLPMRDGSLAAQRAFAGSEQDGAVGGLDYTQRNGQQ